MPIKPAAPDFPGSMVVLMVMWVVFVVAVVVHELTEYSPQVRAWVDIHAQPVAQMGLIVILVGAILLGIVAAFKVGEFLRTRRG